ncbi:MAG: PepSY domain-containing protein [Burkholderiales bacterium]
MPSTLRPALFAVAVAAILASPIAAATGLATCDSGPKSTWQPVDKLEDLLKKKGWTIRRVKEDGGCYEVYALDDKGQRVEAYFHPVTLEPVPTKPR